MFFNPPVETRRRLNVYGGLLNSRFFGQFDGEFYTSNLSTQKSFSIKTQRIDNNKPEYIEVEKWRPGRDSDPGPTGDSRTY